MIGILSAKFFLGFLLCFVAGLKTNVPGHYPLARAMAASALAVAAAWGAARALPQVPAWTPDPALLLVAVLAAYRAPAWALLAAAVQGAAAWGLGALGH